MSTWKGGHAGERIGMPTIPKQGRTRKRYLGRTESISLVRLEETARALSHARSPRPQPTRG